jgi:hypothetical protein
MLVTGLVELEGKECFIASDITEIDSKYKQSLSDLLMAGDNPPPPIMTRTGLGSSLLSN